MSVRRATASDLGAIQLIARRTINASYRSFLGDEGVDWFINSGASDRYISESIDDCRVLIANDAIVGFCVCKTNLIDLMMVDSEKHRQGHGSILLADCETRLFEHHDELRLESFEKNQQANDFYRKNDWIQKDRIFDEAANSYKLIFSKTP